MFKLLKYLSKKDKQFMAIIIALVLSQVALDLKMPDYMQAITTLVKTEGSKMSEILKNGGFMLGCALLSTIISIVNGYFSSNLSADYSRTVRKALFDKVEALAIHEIKSFSPSSLITRTTNDVGQIQMLIGMGLQVMVKAPVTAVFAVIKILNKSWQWSAMTSVAIIILVSTMGTIASIVMPRFKIVQKLIDRLNGISRENVNGIRVVHAFTAEQYQVDKFNKANNELTETQLFNQGMFALLNPIMNIVLYGLTISIYFSGAYIISATALKDKLTVFSNMVVFSSYAMQVISSFLMLVMIFMMLPRAQVSADRINEVLNAEITIKDGDIEDLNNDLKGVIEFKNVSFKYPDGEAYLLKDLSFKVNTGETIAFIGSTGSGKSSIVNLIPRLYDVTDGAVLIDGIDVKDYKQQQLRNKIGYVSQKAVLFDGTVTSNITFGDNGKEEISSEKIQQAIEVAQAKEFVEKMTDKYDSHIAQGGTNVSGGQKQRLSIARAIARDPEIYIFDDTFSALDYKTDSALRKALKEYTKDATVVIVAQRIGTIMNSDNIVVLDNGVCVGQGKHKDLLKNCEVYKEIALSQLSKEELENA